jgi:hypothetical protein
VGLQEVRRKSRETEDVIEEILDPIKTVADMKKKFILQKRRKKSTRKRRETSIFYGRNRWNSRRLC